MPMEHVAPELEGFINASEHGLKFEDVAPGDTIVARTKNSEYVFEAVGDGTFRVKQGGYFEDRGLLGQVVELHGVTGGGSAVNPSVAVARGCCIEIVHRRKTGPARVVTTRVRSFDHYRPVDGE